MTYCRFEVLNTFDQIILKTAEKIRVFKAKINQIYCRLIFHPVEAAGLTFGKQAATPAPGFYFWFLTPVNPA